MPKTPPRKTRKGSSGIDLASLFGAVTNSLADNRETLNKADTYNNDHGDNMVQIFQTIANVVGKSKGVDQASQLQSASEALRKTRSGSAQVYADNLAQASQQFQGQTITPDNAGLLLQALMGSGGTTAAPRQQASSGGGDLLSSLLGGLGGQPAEESKGSDGLDLGDLLNAGMAFMSAKQQGSGNAEALVNALISASPLGQSSHRAQSGAVVANTIMQVLGGLAKK